MPEADTYRVEIAGGVASVVLNFGLEDWQGIVAELGHLTEDPAEDPNDVTARNVWQNLAESARRRRLAEAEHLARASAHAADPPKTPKKEKQKAK